MMDLSFLDNIKKNEEDELLKMVASKIGCYLWQYDNSYVPEDGTHLGPVAQELQEIPGLKDAVLPDENGVLQVDSKYVSLAALSLVAALIRKIYGIKKEENENEPSA